MNKIKNRINKPYNSINSINSENTKFNGELDTQKAKANNLLSITNEYNPNNNHNSDFYKYIINKDKIYIY